MYGEGDRYLESFASRFGPVAFVPFSEPLMYGPGPFSGCDIPNLASRANNGSVCNGYTRAANAS